MRDPSRADADFDLSVASSVLDALSREQRQRLTDVLDQYLRGLESGLPAHPEELVAAHPDLAEALGAYLENLTRLHEVAAAFGHPCEASSAEPQVSAPTSEFGRVGDFVLVREVGRGGMGVVYEARQLSLDRRVALKVLPFAAVLESQQIARFKNEAQAAAQLHHPNIVPVYAVGVERGVHYYAMQYIDGEPLDRAIAGLRAALGRRPHTSTTSSEDAACETLAGAAVTVPAGQGDAASFLSGKWAARADYFRTAIRLAIQAADALGAAHAYGIVHRDVKPSNLLVDGNGKLWVTDFGLARCQSDRALTRTGDVIGTRQYMSPEQALGKAALVDQRSDIYSLGATLYELLTLEPAFAPGDGRVLRRGIDDDEPMRPRLLEPLIPADLETVVLKAMAHERDERYLTAEELADDLRRVLEGKPTVARPPTFWDRAAKFARRHRRVVAGAAAACLVAMLGLAASALVVNRERAAAQRNFERAERHFREARETVDRFGARLAENLADVPGAEAVRRDLLAQTLEYYERFVDEAQGDPALRADLALTYSKIGTLREQMGLAEEAIGDHRQALALARQLDIEEPNNPQHQRRVAVCSNNLALALRRAGHIDLARREFARAIALQQALVAAHPDAVQYRADLALSHNNLGLLESETGQNDAARKSFDRAIELQQAVARATPDDPDVWRDLAASYNNLAALVGVDDPRRAVELGRQAAENQAKVVRARPNEPQDKSQWALLLNNLGAAQSRADDVAGAVTSYRRAIELEKELLRLAPLERGFRRDLAVSYNNLGLTYGKLRQAEDAERSFRNALGFQEQLLAESPHELEAISSLGGMYNNLGIVLEESGRIGEAVENYERAIEHQRAAQQQAGTIDRYREFLSKHYYNLGRALRKLGRADEAARAALARKQLWRDDPEGLLSVAEELALASKLLGSGGSSKLTADGCAELSVATLRDAVAAGLRLPDGLDRNESFAALRGRADFDALVHQ